MPRVYHMQAIPELAATSDDQELAMECLVVLARRTLHDLDIERTVEFSWMWAKMLEEKDFQYLADFEHEWCVSVRLATKGEQWGELLVEWDNLKQEYYSVNEEETHKVQEEIAAIQEEINGGQEAVIPLLGQSDARANEREERLTETQKILARKLEEKNQLDVINRWVIELAAQPYQHGKADPDPAELEEDVDAEGEDSHTPRATSDGEESLKP